MDFSTIVSYVLTVSIIVSIPGPNIMLVINNSITYGAKAGILTVVGIKTGMLFLFAISLTGVVAIMQTYASLFLVMKCIGSMFLVCLGASLICSCCIESKKKAGKMKTHHKNFYIKGFLISVSNPKGLVFAGAFFPQFLKSDLSLSY